MENTSYIGRFAPTPSGPLHFGSLVTAVASYCHARAAGGQWLLRIEDVDTPRVVKGSADDILRTLEGFGFEWDGEVLHQSQRFTAYEHALQQLVALGRIYRCECSRKSLKAQGLKSGPLGMIYPGSCRYKKLTNRLSSQRLDLSQVETIEFIDDHYGPYKLNLPSQVGDIVLRRVDGIYAYHLAVVVDDDYQGVNHIVRGADLLPVTPLHRHLYDLLDFPLSGYLHVPLITNAQGKKLSKQTGATALNTNHANQLLLQALRSLGKRVSAEQETAKPDEILAYAITNWNASTIPADNKQATRKATDGERQ